MKPTTRYKLIPRVKFITTVELHDQQIALLNRLVLGSKDLTDDEALDLWLSLNPYIQVCDHASPRDIFSSLRYAALAALPAKPEPKPSYPVELLNSVRSDIEADGQDFICC
ncbi:hypothetical protein HRE53_30195 (plasmid) [Acaryochloris sp. 'Moss Beach']|uniref:hypothetical protein n=1 Tax=Acaryochloris sp. 'Moss Beach' TaxID=2740837 RepID=UPI001F2E7E9E|nr:hypothetical protein [Acaryochloris sp. 'Moss Beach']UJB73004.1 hypothetical protein HRE53_30195 [Acaryochloris sp. 'Moss Beach']